MLTLALNLGNILYCCSWRMLGPKSFVIYSFHIQICIYFLSFPQQSHKRSEEILWSQFCSMLWIPRTDLVGYVALKQMPLLSEQSCCPISFHLKVELLVNQNCTLMFIGNCLQTHCKICSISF